MSSTPLTQAEVDALPEGTHVLVQWSGGNGPSRYILHCLYDLKIATYRGIHVGFLCDIGDHPLTQVWLP